MNSFNPLDAGNIIVSSVHNPLPGSNEEIFCSNSEAVASELLQNLEEMI